jgi:hypothetical protein
MMFKCNCCGECCRNLDKSDVYQNLDRGDGTCRYLEGNLCSIYSQRPVLCRVDECYELYFKEQYSLEEYYEMNYRICKKLQNEGG